MVPVIINAEIVYQRLQNMQVTNLHVVSTYGENECLLRHIHSRQRSRMGVIGLVYWELKQWDKHVGS